MFYRWSRGAIILLAVVLSSIVHAADQDPAALQALAERFIKMQTAGLPGKMSIDVKPPRNAFPACAALDAFQPPGSRAVGKTIVGVRCLAPAPWTVYLSVEVKLIAPYVVTRLSLPANHVLVASDLQVNEGDLGSLPADVQNDPAALLGHRTISGLASGAPLRTALLRSPIVVQQGQSIRLTLNGPGFVVQTEGQALANASRGDTVRVKTTSGEVVSGVAQEGQQVIVSY